MKQVKSWGQGIWWLSLAVLAALCLLAGCVGSDLNFPTAYQAVFLDNGQVFFGKVSDTGAPYLTLRDVYYVQTLVEKEQKKTANVLVKRGSEWHNPDFMRINTKHVVVIEPVGPDSRVAQLIKEAKATPAPKAESPTPAPAPTPKAASPAPAPNPSGEGR